MKSTRLGLGSAAVALTMFLGGASAALAAKNTPVKVTMNQITPQGVGESDGTITLKQGKKGVEFAIDLSKLPPGEHGFHLHEKGMCEPADKEGKKTAGLSAGGHWDPDATKAHKGPAGGGHKGDLPKLTVPENGKLKTKLTVEGLTMADLGGKALMIHAGGDNYSDTPKPLGGGEIASSAAPSPAARPRPRACRRRRRTSRRSCPRPRGRSRPPRGRRSTLRRMKMFFLALALAWAPALVGCGMGEQLAAGPVVGWVRGRGLSTGWEVGGGPMTTSSGGGDPLHHDRVVADSFQRGHVVAAASCG